MAAHNMTAKTFLDQMLAAKRISEADYSTIKRLVTAKTTISEVTITNNITLKAYCRPFQLEPVSKFFNTAELLEMVLLQVPQHDLLCNVRRVCKGFRIAIDNTPAVQRRLFTGYDVKATAHSPALIPSRVPRLHKSIRENWGGYEKYIEIALSGIGYAGVSPACNDPVLGAQRVFPPFPDICMQGFYYDKNRRYSSETETSVIQAQPDTADGTLGQLYGESEGFRIQMEAELGRGGFGQWVLLITRDLPDA